MTSVAHTRTDRMFAAMVDRGLDAVVLGRQDNTTWATGMHRLWTAGTRPFGAGCVLVAETRGVHLLSSWDDAIPGSVPFEHLYGVTWNPVIMADAMRAIPGLSTASKIGVDALSPGFRRAATGFAPEAELIAVDDLLAELRRRKRSIEVDAIRHACADARAGFDAVAAELAAVPSHPEATASPELARSLRAVAVRAVVLAGGAIPSSGVAVEVMADRVTVDVGVLVDDWEGGLGRTLASDGQPSGERAEERVRSSAAACVAGTRGEALQAAGGAGHWMVRGVGMGFEPPVITQQQGSSVELVAGEVLSVEASGDDGHHREIVHVRDGSPEVLS